MSRSAQYVEVEILGRTCYVSHEDLRIFYGLAGNVTGRRKHFAELPEEAFIVRVLWSRKKNMILAREKQLAGMQRKMLGYAAGQPKDRDACG